MASFDHLNVSHIDPLPSPQDLLQELPITPAQEQYIKKRRQEVCNILDGTDSRLLLIVGPCSIHDITAAKEYATKLHRLAHSVGDIFCVLMRVYFEKPRTVLGWKGFLYDPWLNETNDVATGLRWTRQLLLDLAEMGVAAAAEFLDPASAYYFGDLITWGCVGARTAASQTHRQMASSLSMPVAFKNSTDGNVEIAINGILNAAAQHSFMGINHAGQLSTIHTKGNACGHLVLRGGEDAPNYDPQSISDALERLNRAGLPQKLLIDCSHDNSFRQHQQQTVVFQSVINQIVEGNRNISGVLIESHLKAGNQSFKVPPSDLKYGVSLTDSCLDWETTEQLIHWSCNALNREYKQPQLNQYQALALYD